MKQKVITLIIILIIILVIILVSKWILVFPCFFLQFGLGGAGVQIVETCIFLRGTVMKASSHEKHSKQQWEKQIRPMGKVWGEAWQGTWVWTFFLFFFVFPWFFAVWPKPREHKNKTKKNKKFRPMGKVWAIHTQTKKPKKQKNKKPKNQKNKKTKNKKKNKKNKIAHPKGRGSDAECWVLSFLFFLFFFVFLFFLFFVFLVCVWIAIADVPSRDCQALSVVALEARSIHYSTAMFAMT